MTAITLSTLSINPTEHGRPRPGKPGFGIVGDQRAREVHTFLLLQSFQKSPSGLQQLRQFTLCMPSLPILLNPGHFVTFSTVLWVIWFQSSLLYRIYCSNTKSGWICLCLQSQSLLVWYSLIPKRWCDAGTRTLDLDWNVLGYTGVSIENC